MLVAAPYRRATSRDPHTPPPEREIECLADATYQVDGKGDPVLPGSSFRGAIRAHAERIATTLSQRQVPDTLFGTIDERGLVAIGEGRLDGTPRAVPLNHVAVDRVTGFAAAQKLFSSAALASPVFDMRLTARWHSEETHQAAIALLLLTLRDFSLGQGWVGSRTTRGYGWLGSIELLGGRGSLISIENGTVRRSKLFALPARSTVKTIAERCPEVMKAWRRCLPGGEGTSRGIR